MTTRLRWLLPTALLPLCALTLTPSPARGDDNGQLLLIDKLTH